MHRIGVDKRTNWRDVATNPGELAERKHAEVRQRLVFGEPEVRADVGLGLSRRPVCILIGSRRYRLKPDLAADQLRQPGMHRRIGA